MNLLLIGCCSRCPLAIKGFVLNYNMQGMTKTPSELFAMLKTAEVEIKKEHVVFMVNKTVKFKKSGKKEKGKKGSPKKGDKPVVTPRKATKLGPKPSVECFYFKGDGHWNLSLPSGLVLILNKC